MGVPLQKPKQVRREAIKNICSKIIGESSGGQQEDSGEEDVDPSNQMAVLRRQKILANRAKHGNASTATVSGDPVRATVDQFFTNSLILGMHWCHR